MAAGPSGRMYGRGVEALGSLVVLQWGASAALEQDSLAILAPLAVVLTLALWRLSARHVPAWLRRRHGVETPSTPSLSLSIDNTPPLKATRPLAPPGAHHGRPRCHGTAPTDREREVLALVAQGLPDKAIARQLGVSARTVRYHMANLFAKAPARSRTELVVRAHSNGWLQEPPAGAAATSIGPEAGSAVPSQEAAR
jgi:DNA-binding CsgD family transcriptional regulator